MSFAHGLRLEFSFLMGYSITMFNKRFYHLMCVCFRRVCQAASEATSARSATHANLQATSACID